MPLCCSRSLARRIEIGATAVVLTLEKPLLNRMKLNRPTGPVAVARVIRLSGGAPVRNGTVQFVIDGVGVGEPARLNEVGVATLNLGAEGRAHTISARYRPSSKEDHLYASQSPQLRLTEEGR